MLLQKNRIYPSIMTAKFIDVRVNVFPLAVLRSCKYLCNISYVIQCQTWLYGKMMNITQSSINMTEVRKVCLSLCS